MSGRLCVDKIDVEFVRFRNHEQYRRPRIALGEAVWSVSCGQR